MNGFHLGLPWPKAGASDVGGDIGSGAGCRRNYGFPGGGRSVVGNFGIHAGVRRGARDRCRSHPVGLPRRTPSNTSEVHGSIHNHHLPLLLLLRHKLHVLRGRSDLRPRTNADGVRILESGYRHNQLLLHPRDKRPLSAGHGEGFRSKGSQGRKR